MASNFSLAAYPAGVTGVLQADRTDSGREKGARTQIGPWSNRPPEVKLTRKPPAPCAIPADVGNWHFCDMARYEQRGPL